jgi:hypothetical protein
MGTSGVASVGFGVGGDVADIFVGEKYGKINMRKSYMNSSFYVLGSAIELLRFFVFVCGLALTINAQAFDSVAQSIKTELPKKVIVCPSQDFDKFLNAFTENIEIQMTFTNYPLKTLHLNFAAQPEAKPVRSSLSRSRVVFPIIPDKAKLKSDSLTLRIDELSASRAKISILKVDTDYLVHFYFRKNNCWKLEHKEDWSL